MRKSTKKSLYGLRQASRQWYAKPSQSLCSRGYTHSLNDYSLFFKRTAASSVFIVVYANDIILTGNDIAEITALKSFLDAEFKIKDLGHLNYFLGIEGLYHSSWVLLHQRRFISDLLTEFKCSDVSPVVCPLALSTKLHSEAGDVLPRPDTYRSFIGKLNFLTHTRLDLFFAVQHLSQFLKTPRVPHMEAALYVLRYLKGTPDIGVFLNNSSNLSLHGYCDSDLAACPDTRKYVTGLCVSFGGSLISWKSKKQQVVSLSSAEAEYKALSKFGAELSWLARLFSDLGMPLSAPIPVICDSMAAIHIAKNPVFHERTKHIELDGHFIRTKLADGLISLSHIHTASQPADVFTKSLADVYNPLKARTFHATTLNIWPIYAII
ncbi:PREDICTED: uncharacterized protein LOC109208835 [Nicotiana attenuata]|uniref:uncharacterized protein LOC109208835 n=1 Tax=Nicotiana attenuata TaxID=49451 RepID=UPI0009058991|nr:PREDICTED: uncharacterized protein LOC109208835 [Nicotiana attenuata]